MPPLTRSDKRRRGIAGVTAVGLAVSGAALLLAPSTSLASSHREAPIIAGDPTADGTDVYAFVSPDKSDSVTIIANFDPFQLPAGGPNFNPFGDQDDVRYSIKIDTNGDATPDLEYRFSFSGGFKDKNTFLYNTGPVNSLKDPTLNFQQTYRVDLIDDKGQGSPIVDAAIAAPANVGAASMPDYAKLRQEALASGTNENGTRTFAGPADDPFFLDLRVFDLLYGADLSESGNPTLTGLNVSSIAIQVPKKILLATAGADKSGVIGVHATSERRSMIAVNGDGTRTGSGGYVQVSRLGAPLVNEVVSSVALKDAFNALPPDKDATVKALVDRVKDPEVPKLLEKIYKLPAPAAPRDDLVSIFLTGVKGLNQPTKVVPSEQLRLNINTPISAPANRLGVLGSDKGGFPNGRRLTDDVVDIELQTLAGALQPDGSVKIVDALAKGDGVDANDVDFESTFPYVALPHAGSTTGPGSLGGAAAAGGATTPSENAAPSSPKGGAKVGDGGSASRLPLFGGAALLAGAVLVGVAYMNRRRTTA